MEIIEYICYIHVIYVCIEIVCVCVCVRLHACMRVCVCVCVCVCVYNYNLISVHVLGDLDRVQKSTQIDLCVQDSRCFNSHKVPTSIKT